MHEKLRREKMQHMMGLDSDMGAPDDQAYPRPYGDDSHGPSSG